jgi:hypothetical protein
MYELIKARRAFVPKPFGEKQSVIEAYKAAVVKKVKAEFAQKYAEATKEYTNNHAFWVVFTLPSTQLKVADFIGWKCEELRPLPVEYGWPDKPLDVPSDNRQGRLYPSMRMMLQPDGFSTRLHVDLVPEAVPYAMEVAEVWNPTITIGSTMEEGLVLRMWFHIPE